MDERISQALEMDRVIDITTRGRRTGMDRRIEIWFHNLDGKLYITGPPGARDWYANLVANPEFTFHLKKSVKADVPGLARPVTAPDERRPVFVGVFAKLSGDRDLAKWMEASPLLAVTLAIDRAVLA